jgi:hypothetical protein
MQSWTIPIIVLVVVIAAIAGWLIYERNRSRRLQARFGPEYDRVVSVAGSRRRAESELARREIQARKLRARELSAADRERFLMDWKLCQAQFVDDPRGAVEKADQLLVDIMSTRGYCVDDPDERMTDIVAAYPRHAEGYREAHRIMDRHRHGASSTEDLRAAFLHYRTLFDDLLGGRDEKLERAS